MRYGVSEGGGGGGGVWGGCGGFGLVVTVSMMTVRTRLAKLTRSLGFTPC